MYLLSILLNSLEAFSRHTVDSLGLQAGPGPRFCSLLFSVHSAKMLHSPPVLESLPPKLWFYLYRYYSTAIYSGASSWGLTKRLPFLPMSYWDARQRQLRHISVRVSVITSLCWGSISSVLEGISSLVCSPHCTSSPYFAFLIAEVDGSPSPRSYSLSDPKSALCNSQILEMGQYKNTRAQTHMALAVIWLHILLNKLLDEITSKPSYCNLQYSSTPGVGRLLFLLCVTFKRKERLSCCWRAKPYWALKTHRAMVSREFSKWSVLKIKESDRCQGMNKQMNEQTNKQITKCPGFCMENITTQFQRNRAIVVVHFNTGWNSPYQTPKCSKTWP